MMGYVHQPHAWCRNRCIGLGRNKLMRRWCAIGERGSVHSRRRMLLFGGTVSLVLDWNPQGGLVYANEMDQMQILESVARQAYGEREFQEAERALNELLDMSPNNVAYLEMRATTHVDKKDFEKALSDYDALLGLLREREGDSLNTARLLAGKALAFEGLYRFREAADAYEQSIQIAKNCGSPPDPYVENSLGNCYASLGKWKDARVQYLSSARGFQTSRVSNGRAGGMQRRLDGSIFAFSNAALMAVQLGDDDAALSEMKAIARRAPGSADMRAALAAMYWARGNTIGAESEWEFACNSISVGCAKYEDMDWLERVRRWPPRMIDYMKDFLALKSPEKDA